MIKNNGYFYLGLIALCLYGPLLLSFLSSFINLQFISPRYMRDVSQVKNIIVFASAILGFTLLLMKYQEVSALFKNRIIANITLILSFLYACLMITGAGLVMFLDATFGSHKDYIYQEHTLNDRTFYVYTADPGAFGKAHHYVYLKCPASFNRYELEFIAKLSWIKNFKMSLVSDDLIFKGESEQYTKVLNVSTFHCK
ncbi:MULTISPECIES: hypothetical protein [Pseudoalteromonas]|jgi:hypothetical protein|uniref:Transmembrane protein n=2 Tax=Pseudoalteromonas TaxID=53246 RepID=A0AAD0RZC0_9GAMM|nr:MULTISPECIES: hypothetical protein [Pseudoalteromonas]AXV65299.1 hypothetical protein D0907_08470 [Pseudoalteromonas donghaensis]MAE01375.1 hypothetical protein [Pseudoalteromonas sp.]MCC9659730.1 hypothetical protein [Pseudoalteromonas sp. MB41]QLJ09797.1 hypothetical protein GZH31_08340 [Pseudoalteromonas sp. JSTW]QMW16006.1 hypothetical protein H3302_08110 [Pseudoalteromonas sp. MT33b]|tara:strand:- start:4625 stop:5218 length:594 start_codon:yes stop_codon:yes gene_type:complete